jgi:hypothetical protein
MQTVSIAEQTALDLKANLASANFTGTAGIDKTMVDCQMWITPAMA